MHAAPRRSPFLLHILALGLYAGVASWTTTATADVVMNVPTNCPKGTERQLTHRGPQCVPPLRADCPKGYEPRVYDSTSYCEPPPPAPCPKGTHWKSLGPKITACMLNEPCSEIGSSCRNGSCMAISSCVELVGTYRHSGIIPHEKCEDEKDCNAIPKTHCMTKQVCTDGDTRKHEAARIAAAKDIPAQAVPPPYVALVSGGAGPRYPVLKEGDPPAPLPDVPEPPDEPTNLYAVATLPVDAGQDAPANESASDEEPTPTEITPPQDPPPTPPKGSGGCAGCNVDTSDRDMMGWAALMSLLGLAIAVRQRHANQASKR